MDKINWEEIDTGDLVEVVDCAASCVRTDLGRDAQLDVTCHMFDHEYSGEEGRQRVRVRHTHLVKSAACTTVFLSTIALSRTRKDEVEVAIELYAWNSEKMAWADIIEVVSTHTNVDDWEEIDDVVVAALAFNMRAIHYAS